MGLLKTIKLVFQKKRKCSSYINMSVEELRKLSDEELREALAERLLAEEEKNGWETIKCLHKFKGAKRIYYIVNYFDMEVQNGGLCQYFVNSSKETAPYILKALHVIGAVDYEKILKDFVEMHGIQLNDLKSFEIEGIEEYENQTERYPFDDFDDVYYVLYEKKPLEDILLAYAKEHLDDFI